MNVVEGAEKSASGLDRAIDGSFVGRGGGAAQAAEHQEREHHDREQAAQKGTVNCPVSSHSPKATSRRPIRLSPSACSQGADML